MPARPGQNEGVRQIFVHVTLQLLAAAAYGRYGGMVPYHTIPPYHF